MLLSLLLACLPPVGETADTDSAAPVDTADDLPQSVETFYFGTTEGQTPDGSYVEATKEILFIRESDPTTSTIREEFWQEADRRNFDHGELLNSVTTTDGLSYSFGCDWDTGSGVLRIAGLFTAGEAWAWTGWSSVSTYLDGDYAGYTVASTDSADDAGTHTATKVVANAEGAAIWHVSEVLTPVDETAFQSRLAEIGE